MVKDRWWIAAALFGVLMSEYWTTRYLRYAYRQLDPVGASQWMANGPFQFYNPWHDTEDEYAGSLTQIRRQGYPGDHQIREYRRRLSLVDIVPYYLMWALASPWKDPAVGWQMAEFILLPVWYLVMEGLLRKVTRRPEGSPLGALIFIFLLDACAKFKWTFNPGAWAQTFLGLGFGARDWQSLRMSPLANAPIFWLWVIGLLSFMAS